MLSLLAFLLLIPLDAVPAEASALERDTVETSWAVMLGDGRLRLERGRTVRFEGRGHLVFDAARRHIRVATDAPLHASVDGAAVRGPHTLDAGDVLEWRAGPDTWTIRLAAARSLGQLGDRRGLGSLITTLRGEPEQFTRSDAAWALGTADPLPEAEAALRTALRDESRFVRYAAACSLGRVGSSASQAALQHVRREEPSATLVREAAAWALNRIEAR